jgi:hypothetical protein
LANSVKVSKIIKNREINGEVRYILFVDEADLVSKDSRLGEYTYLVFLKECMEQISKEKQSQNL